MFVEQHNTAEQRQTELGVTDDIISVSRLGQGANNDLIQRTSNYLVSGLVVTYKIFRISIQSEIHFKEFRYKDLGNIHYESNR